MRTIKFRGFNKKNNKWIYGYYLVNRGQHFVVDDGIAPVGNTWEDYQIDPDTLGQFTGLQDKNGKDIYEGDILRTKYGRPCEIYWFTSPSATGLDLYPIDCKHKAPDEDDLYLYKNLEVVGNIHTNPELLNTK